MREELSELFTYGKTIEQIEAEAKQAEQDRITKVARNWISELRGHDSDCDCLIKAEVLENFINHTDFKGEQK